MTDLKAAFEAWVRDEYGHEIIVWRGESPISCPFRTEKNWQQEWTAYQAAHAAAIEAAAGVAHQAEDHYDSLGGEEYGEWIAKQIRALAEKGGGDA